MADEDEEQVPPRWAASFSAMATGCVGLFLAPAFWAFLPGPGALLGPSGFPPPGSVCGHGHGSWKKRRKTVPWLPLRAVHYMYVREYWVQEHTSPTVYSSARCQGEALEYCDELQDEVLLEILPRRRGPPVLQVR